MWKKKGINITNEQFDLRIKDSNFKRITDYTNSKTSILFECKICAKKYKKKPKEFNKLSCSCELRKKQYLDKISDKNIELIDVFTNYKENLKHRCNNCNLIFETKPKTIINSVNGCPSCSGKIFSIEKYKSILPNNISLIDNFYNGSNKSLNHKCLDCSFTWSTKPNYILHMGTGCPKCNRSKGERKISHILDSLNIPYESEYIVKIHNINYRFDFFISSINTFIEFNGIQHYKPIDFFGGEEYFMTIQKNDTIKREWIIENNYNIIDIKYDQDIDYFLLNNLLSILN
jgi:predicted  nucleic acid-binding Zn-ribbon protein